MWWQPRPFKSYTQPGRLQDVLALIQVLGLDERSYRSEDGLRSELQGSPISVASGSWAGVAKEHPEFFRVRPEGEHRVSLVSRHVTPKNENKVQHLPPEFIGKLLQTALDLHDRQVRRDERWIYLVPVGVALIAGVCSLGAVILR